ncbi:unnamed protein product [Leptidea sinapis]|uniref:Uncharacterized protein n=1 Tax=Leptidea sinapis TaxID=189913 RepID=A0A5E4Q7J0_9NEOP|nr:unnamed protein product [Leptidea sinapis]
MTAELIVDAFEYKYEIMQSCFLMVNVCLALLFCRMVVSAHSYHDQYLTSIDFDNMERNRFIDVYSTSYIPSERNKILTHILKVLLEAVTATTFVMLDRLFYEALAVVRQYAIMDNEQNSGLGDSNIEIEGEGTVAGIVRKIVEQLTNVHSTVAESNDKCVPRPRAISIAYYFKIYGGYICILILLYLNPYTLRLRRSFYPHREKQRIVHLYNDILKKRLKMQKTLRRKAVQSVRVHYLSGENLLTLRMKFPQLLSWLSVLPFARMKCLICGDTEPTQKKSGKWHSCICINCPFVYCDECWMDIGSSCLACDPVLNELSDVDSLSDDQPQRH